MNFSGFSSTNAWHHIAGVRDGDTLKFYVNGSLIKQQSGFPTDPVQASFVYFGNDQDTLGGGFNTIN